MRTPRICFVKRGALPVMMPQLKEHGIGGEEVQHALLARALAAQGYNVSMVVGDYGQADGASWGDVKTYKSYADNAGIPVIRFAHPRWTLHWSALRRADADVYYTSCAGMEIGLVAAFCAVHKRRLIFRIASDSDCDRNKLLIQYHRDKLLYEWGLQRADAILAQTEFQRDTLRRNYNRESTLARMMVDWPQRRLPFHQRDIDVLWVSNIRSLKRPDLALDMAEQLSDVQFHIVGGEMQKFGELYRHIEQRARGLPNVTFYGRVPYSHVNEFYERARVFINTSDCEGFPNSYLQAWTRGTPVVAFFDPDGLLSNEGIGGAVTSLADMLATTRRYLAEPALWDQTSALCVEFMRQHFSERQILAPYVALIESLAHGLRAECRERAQT